MIVHISGYAFVSLVIENRLWGFWCVVTVLSSVRTAMLEAPILRPSFKEWQDPFAYLRSVREAVEP